MKTSCRLCGTENTKEILKSLRIYRCKNCECLYRSEDIDYSFYEKTNYWYKGNEQLKLYQKAIYVWFENYIIQGNTVELGASDGDFTSLLRDKINSNYSVGYNELVNMIRPEYQIKNISVNVGPLENFPEKNKYSNIFMINVLEHINNPTLVLEKIRRMLPSGGRFFVATSDGDSINAHNEIIYYREHMCIFGKKAINYICRTFKLKLLMHYPTTLGEMAVIFEKL